MKRIVCCSLCIDSLTSAGAVVVPSTLSYGQQCEWHQGIAGPATSTVEIDEAALPARPRIAPLDDDDPKEVGPVTTIAAKFLAAEISALRGSAAATGWFAGPEDVRHAVCLARELIAETKGA